MINRYFDVNTHYLLYSYYYFIINFRICCSHVLDTGDCNFIMYGCVCVHDDVIGIADTDI